MSPVSRICARKHGLFVCLLLLAAIFAGCKRLRNGGHEMVYVVAQQTYLHDRVAAVSNTVGEVKNGQSLEVLERGKRFLKVKTAKNEIGWIEQHAIIDEDTRDGFTKLADQHKNDPAVATATVRNEAYLHLAPGRNTQRYYLLPANAKLQLLVRASVQKVAPGTPLRKSAPKPTVSPAPAANPAAKAEQTKTEQTGAAQAKTGAKAVAPVTLPLPEMPPPVMEDWWLVRDAQGEAGWILSGGVDVDAPDEIAQYAEGQRIIGAYVLNRVHDEDVDQNGQPVVSEKPQYVAVMTEMKSGLPFDFDQVRVFTWNAKRHRYETAYRLHPIAGFMPVKVTQAPAQGVAGQNGNVPQFSIQIGSPDNVKIDPDTGITSAANPRTINFQLIQTVVRRVGPDLDPITLTKTPDEKKGAKKKR